MVGGVLILPDHFADVRGTVTLSGDALGAFGWQTLAEGPNPHPLYCSLSGELSASSKPAPAQEAILAAQLEQARKAYQTRHLLAERAQTSREANPAYWLSGKVHDSVWGVDIAISTTGGQSVDQWTSVQLTATSVSGGTMDGEWEATPYLWTANDPSNCPDRKLRGHFHLAFDKAGFHGVYGSCDAPPTKPWTATRIGQ
jgi:hypothetical protein